MSTLPGRLLLPDGSLRAGEVHVDAGLVARVEERPAGRVPDRIVAPGFIDLQVNGHEDLDVASAAGTDWDRMDHLLLSQGVTAWCPTLVTAGPDSYPPALGRLARAAGRPGARPAVLGAHLEGPFLGARPGAHDRERVAAVDLGWLLGLEGVRMVTLGPEAPGALDAVAALAARGVLVGLGHTDATYEQAEAAASAGARVATHLFNAMGPLHHRRPGVVGAALTDPRLTPTLIADLVHVHPAVVLAVFRARAAAGAPFGDPGVALVTDAVGWRAGALAGARVGRAPGDAPRLADGTLAGSTLTMDRAVANVVSAGVDPADALRAAAQVPARLLADASRGRLVPGARADLVVLGADLSVLETWVGGHLAWGADASS